MLHLGAAARSLDQARRTGTFDAARARAGAKGERLTLRLLDRWFLNDHDIHAFHDLTIPARSGTLAANVDHVLVRGRTVIVIDTKRWSAGTYWTIAGRSFRGFDRFPEADKRTVGMAMDRYRERLPDDTEIHGVLLVHPTGDAHTHLWALRPPDKVRVRVATRSEPLLRSLLGRPVAPDPDVLNVLWSFRQKKATNR